MGRKRRAWTENTAIPIERITRAILLIRGQKVILDEALAALYEVEVKALNQAVGRNRDRFPADFMFQLTREEGRTFKVTICDLKNRERSASQVLALRFHRARRCHAIQRATQQTRRPSEHRNHACLARNG